MSTDTEERYSYILTYYIARCVILFLFDLKEYHLNVK